MLNAVLFYKHRKSPVCEAIVDSGSQTCLFHADLGQAMGMRVESGIEGPLGGVIDQSRGKVYYHKVRMLVAGESLEIVAGFSPILFPPIYLAQQSPGIRF